ncbi:nicotianamine synthase family protein [Desulfolithobacter sp.]
MHYFPIDHDHELTEHEFLGCCKDCERSHRLVKKHLCDFHKRISGYSQEELRSLSQMELYQLYLVLDDIAHLDCGNHLARLILADHEIETLLPAIRRYYTTFFDLHENALAREVITAPDPWHPLEVFGLYPRYLALIRSQVETIDLPRPYRLAFVGCGPVPLSLILLHQLYGISSIGLDSDPHAVSLARKGLARLGLDEAIEIIEGTEETLGDIEWDLVLVAALAEPKSRIFANLARIMAATGKRPVICRTYSGLRGLLHPPMTACDYRGFKVKYEINPGGRVNNTLLQLELIDDTRR